MMILSSPSTLRCFQRPSLFSGCSLGLRAVRVCGVATSSRKSLPKRPLRANIKAHRKDFSLFKPDTWSNVASIGRYFQNKRSSEAWRVADGQSEDFNLVYKIGAITYIELTYVGTQVCALTLPISLIHSYINGLETFIEQAPATSAIAISFFSFIAFTVFKVVRIFPSRIYYSESNNKFVAVYFGLLPWQIRKVEFLPGEAKKKYAPSSPLGHRFSFTDNIFTLNSGKNLGVFPLGFVTPLYYNKIVGY